MEGEPIYPPKWDYRPTGELRLLIEYGYGHKAIFEDRPGSPLEEQLNEVVLSIARASIETLKPARLAREEAERRRHEEEQQRWAYQQKCDRFDSAYRAWRDQQDRVRFVTVLEEAVAARPDVPENVREYVAWARRYVEAHDPLPKFFEAVSKKQPSY